MDVSVTDFNERPIDYRKSLSHPRCPSGSYHQMLTYILITFTDPPDQTLYYYALSTWNNWEIREQSVSCCVVSGGKTERHFTDCRSAPSSAGFRAERRTRLTAAAAADLVMMYWCWRAIFYWYSALNSPLLSTCACPCCLLPSAVTFSRRLTVVVLVRIDSLLPSPS